MGWGGTGWGVDCSNLVSRRCDEMGWGSRDPEPLVGRYGWAGPRYLLGGGVLERRLGRPGRGGRMRAESDAQATHLVTDELSEN